MADNHFINVAIIGDHPGLRAGIKKLLLLDEKIRVVGEGRNSKDVIQLAKMLCPDIILVDLDLESIHGYELITQLQHELPQIKILVLSSFSDHFNIQAMMKKGASAYITKDEVPERLISILHDLAESIQK